MLFLDKISSFWKALVHYLLQIISSHPLVGALMSRVLSRDPEFRKRLSSEPSVPPEKVLDQTRPFLFLVDTSTLVGEVSGVCRQLRSRCPGSKFLALLPPHQSLDESMLRLVYAGCDGTVCLTGRWESELSRAVRAIASGNLWIPQHVLREYVTRTNVLLDLQLGVKPCLTAREHQVVQFIGRQLSNKEISAALEISERTVKFHVTNILAKAKVQNRRELMASINPLVRNWSARPVDQSFRSFQAPLSK